MNTRVHYVIVKAATQLLGDMAMDFLNAPINQDNWKKVKEDLGIGEDVLDGLKQETYLDLVMIGAFLEDKPKIKSGISEPKIRDPFVKWAFEQCEPGDYQHWLEHFWNDGLNKDKGLVIDITYICDVIAETLWGKGLGEYFTELTSGIIELIGAPITAICKDGSLVLDSFRSAPARAEEYWAALIKEYKKGMFQKLFPKEGETVPKVRFPEFSGDWEKRKVSDVAVIIAGGTPSTGVDSYWEPKEIPWLSSGEVHKKYITFTDNMISSDGMNHSSARMVKENSVLIALAGQGKTRGTVAINRIPLTTNQSIAAMTFNEDIVPEFVFANLDGRYEEIRKMSSGDGARGGLNKQIVGDIIIPYTSIEEQRRIASLLTGLDSIITLHQRKLDAMKEYKKGLLQQMFV